MKVEEFVKIPVNCPCGRDHRVSDIEYIEIGSGALDKIPCALEGRKGIKALVVCDENTYRVAGERVCRILDANKTYYRLVKLEGSEIHADEHAVAQVTDNLGGGINMLIAAGSGTVNDVCRYVGGQRDIPFLCVMTAPSMDGPASPVAAMTFGGCKATIVSRPPFAIIADTDVLVQAPKVMINAGVGDILGKYVSIADWKISHLITGEYYCDEVASIMMEATDRVRRELSAIRDGEPKAIEGLTYALILSGIAMSMAGNSRPASGGEHHMGHFYEMMFLRDHKAPNLHGTNVGVATGIICRLYHENAKQAIALKAPEGLPVDRIRAVYGSISDGVIKENTPYPLADVTVSQVLSRYEAIQRIISDLPTGEEVENMLRSIGAAATAQDIRVDDEWLQIGLHNAAFTRKFITFFRVLTEMKA